MWSCTLQRLGSPSQPSRFFPLNSGLKPSLANAPRAHNKSAGSSFFIIWLGPFDGYGTDLDVLGRPVLSAPGNLGNLFHYIITFHHFAEHAVLVIQMGRDRHAYKKRAAVVTPPEVVPRE